MATLSTPQPKNFLQGNNRVLNIRCPYCRKLGAFHTSQNVNDVHWQQAISVDGGERVTTVNAGMKICPNEECGGLVFAIYSEKEVLTSYPPELEEFDPADVPASVRSSMTEAIICHSQGCFRAAALMVRRTLEEICLDRGAAGANLAERLDALGKQIVIPAALIEGAHELRFLGNDAAHVEAKAYSAVGTEQVSAAITLAIVLIRATYQMTTLVERLKSFKPK